MQYNKLLLFSCFKILGWQCWKTAAVHQRVLMLDEWDENNELTLLEPVVKRAGSNTTSFTFSTLVAVLVEWLPECCTEEDGKEPPVPRRRVDERIRIWAPLPNSVGRLVSKRWVVVFFTSFYNLMFDVFALIRFKVLWRDHSSTKSLIAAVTNSASVMLITSNLFFKQQL